MKTHSLLQAFLMLPSLLIGTIVETSHFEDILTYVDGLPQKTIVVCDLDNTLIIPCEPLGSVAWAEHVQKQLQSKGISKKDSEIVEHILWKTVQPHIEVQTVDAKTAEILQELKNRGIPVLGLTARFPDDAEFTFKQLRSVDLDFSQQQHLPLNLVHLSLEPYALYENGILFATTNNKKSEVLLKFLEIHQIDVEYIIFVDDKHHHVEDIEVACRKHGLGCLGVRFSGADKHMEGFDPAIADFQWETFQIEL